MNSADFKKNLDVVRDKLQDLTGIIDVERSHPLTEWLTRAENNYMAGKKRLGCAQAAYAKFVSEDLQKIKDHDHALHREFKKGLKRIRENKDYFGWRMEVRMASALISKEVLFEKSETPDFLIPDKNGMGIECTSCHLDLSKSHNPKKLTYKISSAIRNKSKHKYAVSSVLLAIDMSNLLFHEGKEDFPTVLADKDKVALEIKNELDASPFDGLLAFGYAWTHASVGNGVTLTNYYWRFESSTAFSECIEFLDQWYPCGDHWVEAHLHERV